MHEILIRLVYWKCAVTKSVGGLSAHYSGAKLGVTLPPTVSSIKAENPP